MLQRFNKYSRHFAFSISLFTITVLAYGLFLTEMGFYWDEWPFLWFHHAYGADGVLKYFAHNRPFWGYIYATTMPILGTNPITWQIFGLVLRFISGITLFWVLRKLWLNRTWESAAASILFVVYPSFMQHSISLMYGHFYIVLISFFLSLGLMIKAIQTPSRFIPYTLVAMLASAVNLFCMEYFFGLELLRPFILFFIPLPHYPSVSRRILILLKHWMPYLLIVAAYLYWRIFLFKFPTYQPEGLISGGVSLQSIWFLVLRARSHLKVVLLDIWALLVNPPELQAYGNWLIVLYWVVVVAALLIVVGLFGNKSLFGEKVQTQCWREMLLLSIPALLLAGIPFLVTDLRVELDFPRDRFTLPYMLGGSLGIIGLLSAVPLKQNLRVLLIGIVVALSTGLQMIHASTFKADWEFQKDLYWQLHWRAPMLKPGTLVMAEDLPSLFESDNSLTAPLNWMYAPDFSGEDIPYLFAFISVRTETGALKLKPNAEVSQFYRLGTFSGNTNNAVVLHFPPNGCLWLLDPPRDQYLPRLEPLITEALPFSNPMQVSSQGAPSASPAQFAGSELPHEWCYYFQKAELARFYGNWNLVVELGKLAADSGFIHRDPAEELVFIEGNIHTEAWDEAFKRTKIAISEDENLQRALCYLWADAAEIRNLSFDGLDAVVKTEKLLSCPKNE